MNNSIQNLSLGKPDSNNGYRKHKDSDAGMNMNIQMNKEDMFECRL